MQSGHKRHLHSIRDCIRHWYPKVSSADTRSALYIPKATEREFAALRLR